MEEIKQKKRNNYVSYIKGFAIFAVIIIHFLDWGAASLFGSINNPLKELLYPGVMFFVSMIGALVYVAYSHSDDLKKSTFKLLRRGAEVIGVYYVYSIVKLFIFDFDKQHFFGGFINSDRVNDLINILTLKVSDVPITILFTLGLFLIISPIFLFIIKKTKYPKTIISAILLIVIFINYFVKLPDNTILNHLYSKGLVVFPFMLWLVPYIIGILLAMIGFEKHKKILTPVFVISTIAYGSYLYINNMSILPTWHMYPLDLYYVLFSLAVMYILIYIFSFLEKIQSIRLEKFMKFIAFAGEKTLPIYTIHWIVIDLTYFVFSPKDWAICITIPIALTLYFVYKLKLENIIKNKTIINK